MGDKNSVFDLVKYSTKYGNGMSLKHIQNAVMGLHPLAIHKLYLRCYLCYFIIEKIEICITVFHFVFEVILGCRDINFPMLQIDIMLPKYSLYSPLFMTCCRFQEKP